MCCKLIWLLIVLMAPIPFAPLPAAAVQQPQLRRTLRVACEADITGDRIVQTNCATLKGYPYMRGMQVLFETTWFER
jgi:hypothetical protein